MLTKRTNQMIVVQGEIMAKLVQAGLSTQAAQDVAADLFDYVILSPIADAEYTKEYKELDPWEEGTVS